MDLQRALWWIQSEKLWFLTDIPHNKVYSLNMKGELQVYDDDSGYANGLNIDKNGNIWYARHNSSVTYKKFKGEKKVVASTYKGKDSPVLMTLLLHVMGQFGSLTQTLE